MAADSSKPPGNGKRIAAYVALGVGAVGLGAGTFFVLSSHSKHSQANDKYAACGGSAGCTNSNPLSSEVGSLDDSARSARTLGIVSYAVGVVGIGAGVTLFVLSGDKKQASGWSFSPQLGLNGARVTGTF